MFQQLVDDINNFLEREILSKHVDDRTKKEDLLLETGRAFADGLVRYRCGENPETGAMARTESALVGGLRAYNEVNREYDLREADASILEKARRGRK